MAACLDALPQTISSLPPSGSDIHRYTCKSYTNNLLINLHSLWRSEYFCDVELAAGNFTVKVTYLMTLLFNNLLIMISLGS